MPETSIGAASSEATKSIDILPTYDENAASVFWGLIVPADKVPGGATAIPNKLEFCLNIVKK